MANIIINLIILGTVKILDNMIMTAKSITTYKGMKMISSILVAISQFMFIFVIDSVVEDGSTLSTIVVCICSGIGTYIAMQINDKMKRDSMYTNILTCTPTESIDNLCYYLLENKIKYIPIDSYNRKNERTKSVIVFAKTKYESTLIDVFIDESETKFLREIIR